MAHVLLFSSLNKRRNKITEIKKKVSLLRVSVWDMFLVVWIISVYKLPINSISLTVFLESKVSQHRSIKYLQMLVLRIVLTRKHLKWNLTGLFINDCFFPVLVQSLYICSSTGKILSAVLSRCSPPIARQTLSDGFSVDSLSCLRPQTKKP